MELNPNHPATIAARDIWHKIAYMLMRKLGKSRVVIAPHELKQFFDDDGDAITIRFDDNIGVELRIVDANEAEELVRREGGLAV